MKTWFKENWAPILYFLYVAVNFALATFDVATDWLAYQEVKEYDFQYQEQDDAGLTPYLNDYYFVFCITGTLVYVAQTIHTIYFCFATMKFCKEDKDDLEQELLIALVITLFEEAFEDLPLAYLTIRMFSTGSCLVRTKVTSTAAFVSRVASLASTVFRAGSSWFKVCRAVCKCDCWQIFSRSLLSILVTAISIAAFLMDFAAILAMLNNDRAFIHEILGHVDIHLDKTNLKDASFEFDKWTDPAGWIDSETMLRLASMDSVADIAIVARANINFSHSAYMKVNQSSKLERVAILTYANVVFEAGSDGMDIRLPCKIFGIHGNARNTSTIQTRAFIETTPTNYSSDQWTESTTRVTLNHGANTELTPVNNVSTSLEYPFNSAPFIPNTTSGHAPTTTAAPFSTDSLSLSTESQTSDATQSGNVSSIRNNTLRTCDVVFHLLYISSKSAIFYDYKIETRPSPDDCNLQNDSVDITLEFQTIMPNTNVSNWKPNDPPGNEILFCGTRKPYKLDLGHFKTCDADSEFGTVLKNNIKFWEIHTGGGDVDTYQCFDVGQCKRMT